MSNNEKKEKGLSQKEIEKRAAATQGFLSSDFYLTYFKPEIELQIEINNKISKVNDNTDQEILNDFRKFKNRHHIYKGLLSKLEAWAKKSNIGGN